MGVASGRDTSNCLSSASRSRPSCPPAPAPPCRHAHLLLRLPRGAGHVVPGPALVLAEGAHLVLVLSAPGGLEVCVGHRGRSEAHELAQGLREGPQPVLHAGQEAAVAWNTGTGRRAGLADGGVLTAQQGHGLSGCKPTCRSRGSSTGHSRSFHL